MAALAALTAVAAIAALACGGSKEAPADATYTVRAEIVRLPDAPSGELYLHHESVPDFRNSAGKTIGMSSMTMPFAAADGLDLSRFSPGDRATVTFEVRWGGGAKPLRVTSLEPLPAGTQLAFDAPAQPTPESAAAAETPSEERPK